VAEADSEGVVVIEEISEVVVEAVGAVLHEEALQQRRAETKKSSAMFSMC
jgi:hypothetical protein